MGAVCGSLSAHEPRRRESKKREHRDHLRVIEAAALGDLIEISGLIGLGASVNSCDHSGRSALHLASAEGRLEIVEYLIEHNANLFIKDKWGNEPLHEACMAGHTAVIQALIRAGAILSSEFKLEMEMKIRNFAAQGKLKELKGLVESGFWFDSYDYAGRTALHVASENGRHEIVEYLLKLGADARAVDHFGHTPLMLAERGNHFSLIQLLFHTRTSFNESSQSITKEKRRWKANLSAKASFTVMEAFSQPIATAMLNGRQAEPFTKDTVSVLCSDICGFTTMSGSMAAEAVARLLNRLFRKFDRLAHLHGVQKVDIVGDAYIAATNLTEDQPHDHAARLARFAVDMLAAARETPLDENDDAVGEGVPLRIGLHCGPVSAVLVGPQAVKFTLVGEAATTAARMESSGSAGRVHCSAAFAAAVAEQAHDITTRRRSILSQLVS